jgi:hypothetical protein
MHKDGDNADVYDWCRVDTPVMCPDGYVRAITRVTEDDGVYCGMLNYCRTQLEPFEDASEHDGGVDMGAHVNASEWNGQEDGLPPVGSQKSR